MIDIQELKGIGEEGAPCNICCGKENVAVLRLKPDTGGDLSVFLCEDCRRTVEKLMHNYDNQVKEDTTEVVLSRLVAQIIVKVKGGRVQNVYADRHVDVEVADLDVQDDLDFRSASEKIEEAQKLGWACVW